MSLEVSMKVTASCPNEDYNSENLMLSLINIPYEYKGSLIYKPIWMLYALMASASLKTSAKAKDIVVLDSKISLGTTLQIYHVSKIEIGEAIQWNQGIQTMVNGMVTDWTFEGRIIPSRIPHLPSSPSPHAVRYLRTLGILADTDKNGFLVIRHTI